MARPIVLAFALLLVPNLAAALPPCPGSVSRDQDLQAIKEQINQKNAEVDALRQELEDIRRRLGDRNAEKDTLKRKATPKTQESGR